MLLTVRITFRQSEFLTSSIKATFCSLKLLSQCLLTVAKVMTFSLLLFFGNSIVLIAYVTACQDKDLFYVWDQYSELEVGN